MGIGCPESFVGLNPAIQIHMSSAPPERVREPSDSSWLELHSFIITESTRLEHDLAV